MGSWRAKETDRIAAMTTELRKFGATVEEGGDHLSITPASLRPNVAADTYDDHRMAMSFLPRLPRRRACPHQRSQCVAKMFPDYFGTLAYLSPASQNRTHR